MDEIDAKDQTINIFAFGISLANIFAFISWMSLSCLNTFFKVYKGLKKTITVYVYKRV